MKGAVLNSIVYELGERVSNDTDILVNEKELDQFIEVLETLGYIQGYIFFAFYYTEKLFPGTFGENILEMFQPDDVTYLNQYRGRDNTEEIYTWKEEFEQRVFSDRRVEEARKNIEEEEKRRKSIINMLGNEK